MLAGVVVMFCSASFEFTYGCAVAQPRHLREAVEDEDADEVVVLVLDAACEEAGGVGGEGFAVEVGGGHGDMGRAEDVAADFWDGKAALVGGLGPSGGVREGWVDVHDWAVGVCAAVGSGVEVSVGSEEGVVYRRDVYDEEDQGFRPAVRPDRCPRRRT